ncbi:MAG: DNA-3-methyladenine glycosylase [Phycisphaerales bacterium]|nr:DNA-3-methyladenine glycosylase [Phycisphaerales bacterium]
MPDRFGDEQYTTPADQLARILLGCTFVRTLLTGERLAGIITETEAYLGPEDRASHAFNNHRSDRNESMYAKPGTAYVYFTYGMHHCFNISCLREGHPAAVLIRAIHPTEDIEVMRAHRTAKPRKTPLRDRDLCNGPAKLCQALAIDRSHDGLDLTQSAKLAVFEGARVPDARIERTPRIGVGYAGAWAAKPLRWVLKPD